METAVHIIYKDLTEDSKLIRFHHPTQDLRKVCTLVDVFYNGNLIEDKMFFLERQSLNNNMFDLAVPEKTHSVKIRFLKASSELNYDLKQLSVEII